MKKEAVIAIFFGVIMLFSTAGFAIINSTYQIAGGAQQEKKEIPSFVSRQLERTEVIQLLRSGRTVIEHGYPKTCTVCAQDSVMLAGFAEQLKDFVTVSSYTTQENLSVFQVIGRGGSITELENGITYDSLFDIFCSTALKQPRECLLRDITKPKQQEIPANETQPVEKQSP